MDDGRLTPFTDEFRTREEVEDAQSPLYPDADRNSLAHRPRAQRKLEADTLDAAPPPSQRSARKSLPSHLAEARSPKDREPDAEPDPKDAPDLRPFADQLIAIAEQLRTGDFAAAASSTEKVTGKLGAQSLHAASGEGPLVKPDASAGADDVKSLDLEQRRQAFAHMARTAYAKRRKRTSIFGDPELFGEPGWDILLDLYIAQVEEKPVSVSSACIGSASPPTTGLRWLGVLTEQGLIAREHDPLDQRRVLVRLTDKALEAMDTYFSSSATLQTDRRAARA